MLGRAPKQTRLCPIFMKIWIPINGTQQCGIRSPEIHKNSMGSLVVNGTLGFWGVTIDNKKELNS